MDDDRLTYSLSGTDAAAFSIVTTTGQLRTLGPLDFETKPSYSVTVEVHDGLDGLGQPSMSIDDMQDVTITIENVEEQGTVTLSSDTGTIQARVPVMATLADDDRPTSGRHVAVGALAEREDRLGGHPGGDERHLRTDGRRRGQLHTR